jgi:DNA-binding transcriptional ArsR family regulator
VLQLAFVQSNNVVVNNSVEISVSGIAAAIGEPTRARILYCLLDGHARTSTELSIVAEVSPSTASDHLNRLKQQGLVSVLAQGKHRYYSLDGRHVAAALEALTVVAAGSDRKFVPSTPNRLREARTCYDHMAGVVAVALHDRFTQLGWFVYQENHGPDYELTHEGATAFRHLGIDIDATQALRRRFACPCVDWSERRPHLGGALGAAVLNVALKKGWVTQDLDSRALQITSIGRRELNARFGLKA